MAINHKINDVNSRRPSCNFFPQIGKTGRDAKFLEVIHDGGTKCTLNSGPSKFHFDTHLFFPLMENIFTGKHFCICENKALNKTRR